MNKYFLVGIPRCGKSTLGKKVAEILELPFFDTDAMVCESLELSDPMELMIATMTGRFFQEQPPVLKKLKEHKGVAIIATGAEVGLMPECVDMMMEMGTIIYLERSADLILELIKRIPQEVIVEYNGVVIDDRKECIVGYAKEISQYEDIADVTIDNNGSEEEGAIRLVDVIKQCMQNYDDRQVTVSR